LLDNPDPAHFNPFPAQAAGTRPSLDDKLHQDIEVRRAHYRTMRQTYEAFNQLTDTAFADQAKMASTTLVSSIANIKGVQVDPTAAALIPDITDAAVNSLQAGDIQKHNRILLGLAAGYQSYWESDQKTWRDFIEQKVGAYSTGIGSVPPESFEAGALAQFASGPYGSKFLIGLYKLKIGADARTEANALEEKLTAVGQSLSILKAAHAELAKDKPSLESVGYSLTLAQTLLNDIQTPVTKTKKSDTKEK
jgi:hypothetical protein